MPARTPIATGGLIVATIATAAGLNLAVMGLDRVDTAPAGQAPEDVAATPAATEVELTSAPVDPVAAPVMAIGLASNTVAGDDPEGSATAPSDDGSAAATNPTPTAAAPATSPTSPAGPSSVSSTTLAPSTEPAPAPPPDTTGPTTSEPTTTSTPPTSPPSTSAPTTPPTTMATSTEYLTYEFEGIASIIVALHDGNRLEYWSVDPEEGWAFLVEDRGPREVKVKFRPKAGGEEAEFEVNFDDGRLKVKREY